jgi:hypothetical protein
VKEGGEWNRGETYEALLHPLNDFTNPNESHILPHSWILIGTWGFRMIRIDPYYQLSSLVFGPPARSLGTEVRRDINIPDSCPYRISLSYPLLLVIHNERQSIISLCLLPPGSSNPTPHRAERGSVNKDLTYLPSPNLDTV